MNFEVQRAALISNFRDAEWDWRMPPDSSKFPHDGAKLLSC